MGIYLNPGNEGFRRALRSDIYVDKSELIAYTNTVLDSDRAFLCVSRPRRFGKSMAANMLCAYYDRSCNSSSLFEQLKISKASSYMQHLNQYDVFMLNIQQFLRAAGTADQLVSYMEGQILQEVRSVYGKLLPDSADRLPSALAAIYANMEEQNRGFIFIIDEWDCIFRESQGNSAAQKDYLNFLRDLFKDRVYVKLAYMTGILPIKKYGTHSALNIFDEFSMTSPRRLAEYTGFTEQEVRHLCETYEMDFDEARYWYDGYHMRNAGSVYNPKSIVDVIHNQQFRSYWTRTETYEALKIYIDMNFDGLKDAVIFMLGGRACKIDTETFQNDMTTFISKDDALTLLVHLGYLSYDESNDTVCIPNEEVRAEFIRAVKSSGWEEVIRAVELSR